MDGSPLTEPPICPMIAGIEDPNELTWIMRPFFRDLPYDFSTLLENVADPAHVPFSHHGVQGNRDSVKYGMYDMENNTEARWGGRSLDIDDDNFHVRLFGRLASLTVMALSRPQPRSFRRSLSARTAPCSYLTSAITRHTW